MGVEIERKFIVVSDAWRRAVSSQSDIAQGYLSRDSSRTVRIRRRGADAFITIKGAPVATPDGAPTVAEFEYPIPAGDADSLLALCLPGAIQKTRHIVLHDGHTWEVDVFHGDNAGLVIAEIELKSATESFSRPEWLGQEVSSDRRYSNAALSEKPYKSWKL